MNPDAKKYCVKQSRQVKRFTKDLDPVEFDILMVKMAREANYALPSQKPRLTPPFRFDGRLICLVWRYHGERTPNSRRKIIYWDYVQPVEDKPHGYVHAVKLHAIATAIVSMLGAGATYVYHNWSTLLSLIGPTA